MTTQTLQNDGGTDLVNTTLHGIEDAGLTPLSWLSNAWFTAMADIGNETISFLATRLREDMKTQDALLHCKSMQDIQQVQVRFIETAVDQYTSKTEQLIKKGTGFVGVSLEKRHATPV